MAHVQLAARVRQHRADVKLAARITRVGFARTIGVVRVPVPLRLRLDLLRVVFVAYLGEHRGKKNSVRPVSANVYHRGGARLDESPAPWIVSGHYTRALS